MSFSWSSYSMDLDKERKAERDAAVKVGAVLSQVDCGNGSRDGAREYGAFVVKGFTGLIGRWKHV